MSVDFLANGAPYLLIYWKNAIYASAATVLHRNQSIGKLICRCGDGDADERTQEDLPSIS